MRALTVVVPTRLDFYGSLMELLISRGIISSWRAVSPWKAEEMQKISQDRFMSKTSCMNDLPQMERGCANQYLAGLEEKYTDFNLGMILAGEKRSQLYFRNGLSGVANMLMMVEEVFEDYKPETLITDFPATAMDMFVYQLCKSREIPTIFMNGFRMRGRLCFFYEPEKGLKEYISFHYHLFKESGVPEDLRQEAKRFLEEFRKTSYKPSSLDVFGFKKPSVIKKVFSGKVFTITKDILNSPSSAAEKITKNLQVLQMKMNWRKVFTPLDSNDRIIFFPLHYQPEASTYVRSPFFRNQYAVIENLCMSIPAGYTLYVKENPLNIWRRPVALYKELLTTFPNLKFVDLEVDSHDIIKRAKLVVVLSSTAGWEAFLYGVPVIVMGTPFYRQFEGVYAFEDYPGLTGQVKEIVEKHRPDEEEMITAIAASLAGSFPGYINDPRFDPKVLDEDNLENVADMVRAAIDFHPQWLKSREQDLPIHSD